jgi:hypothetical protein
LPAQPDLATDAEANLGFGQAQPLLYRSVEAQPSILSLDRQLAQQVHSRLEAGEALATGMLSQHRGALLALATRLADAKTLDGSEVRSLLAQEMNAVTPGSKRTGALKLRFRIRLPRYQNRRPRFQTGRQRF